MQDLLSNAVSQVPALAVLAGIVVIFVKDRASSMKMFADAVESFQEQVGKMYQQTADNTKDCREIQDESHKCMSETARAVRELLIEIRHDRNQGRLPGQ